MWLRVDYILAFSEWLYSHQFPIEEALGHLQWALSLLTERGGGGEQGEEGEEGGGGGGGGEGVDGPECRVLERAVCVLVMMAQLQGRGSTGHRESCLAAVAYCNLIWKVIFTLTHTPCPCIKIVWFTGNTGGIQPVCVWKM